LWFRDLIKISLRQLLRHWRRYWGVALTISLGVAGFITVVTMGEDFKNNLNDNLELIGGVTVIRVTLLNEPGWRPLWFQPDIIDSVREIKGVRASSRLAHKMVKIEVATRNWTIPMAAVDAGFWKVRGFNAFKGELFGQEDLQERRRVCVIGKILLRKLFKSRDMVGRYIKINGELYLVSGVLGGTHASDLAERVYLPLSTASDRIPYLFPDRLYVRCNTWDDVERVSEELPVVIGKFYDPKRIDVQYSYDALQHVLRVVTWSEFFVYLTILATLLLGGLGIWTIMMSAVRTRTREIGLKKAMGALDRDILSQFLTEALCLSVGSALVGIIAGRIAVQLASHMLKSPVPEDIFLSCVSMGFLMALGLGIGAGIYPSIRASRMQVAEATRYE